MMLTNPTIDKLNLLKLHGMAKTLTEQLQQPDINELSTEERLALMIDNELLLRENKRLQTRLKKAKLMQSAALEDIDYQAARGLDKRLLLELSNCQWVKAHRNILITGATGTGKTYLACALAHKACLEGYASHYQRMTRLMPEISLSRADGSYSKHMSQLAKIDILILDDWGLVALTQEQRQDLLEILDDRHNKSSTIVTSQLPIKLWHEMINDNTLADAILDRIVHNAYRIELKGESMRKTKAGLTKQETA
jgi:DNA replication protein DnaC